MALTFVYTRAAYRLLKADSDFDTADVRVKLLMSSTTADTETGANSISEITTLDEFDGSGYTALDLANLSVYESESSRFASLDAFDGTFGATVSAGSRQIVALLYYVRVDGTTANDYPLMYDDSPPQFPMTPDGGPINITLPATGFVKLSC